MSGNHSVVTGLCNAGWGFGRMEFGVISSIVDPRPQFSVELIEGCRIQILIWPMLRAKLCTLQVFRLLPAQGSAERWQAF